MNDGGLIRACRGAMGVDRFGSPLIARYINKIALPQDGSGNYSIKGKRLRYVGKPTENHNAATKEYVDGLLEKNSRKNGDYIDLELFKTTGQAMNKILTILNTVIKHNSELRDEVAILKHLTERTVHAIHNMCHSSFFQLYSGKEIKLIYNGRLKVHDASGAEAILNGTAVDITQPIHVKRGDVLLFKTGTFTRDVPITVEYIYKTNEIEKMTHTQNGSTVE